MKNRALFSITTLFSITLAGLSAAVASINTLPFADLIVPENLVGGISTTILGLLPQFIC